MKNFIKTTTAFCLAALGMLSLMSCEGADLYKVNAPDWLADMELEEEELNIVEVTPSPEVLGETNNSTPWWTVFTDDIKAEPGMTYQVKFINYGGKSNWTNFLIVLRNEAKNVEYAVLRADNWGWTSADTDGANSDKYFMKKMESDSRDWAAWLKAMSMAKCTATIANYGNGKCDVKISMLGVDNVTYTQEYTDISVDQDDLYFSFTCEGSHLEFGDFDVEDSEPTAIELNGIPKKVLLGTTEEEVLANLKATVTFGEGVTKDVETSDLQIMTIPDMNSLGTKTVVAVYNKTFLGKSATTPVIGQAVFEVVETLTTFTCIGNPDNTCGFREYKSENFKVAPGETYVHYFTNYTNGATNWNNFIITLCKADNTEYGFVRADNWGTGSCYWDGCQTCDWNWDVFTKVLDGAKVTTYVTNNGDGTADVKAVVIGSDGNTYTQNYTGLRNIDANDFCFYLSTEKGHLEFDYIIGADNNTSGFREISTEFIKVPAGKTYVNRFINYTDGATNWNNFIITLCKADNTEYGFVRADNWGTGSCYWDGCQTCDWNWDVFTKVLDGAKVTTYVTNNGDGTADVKAVVIGSDGNTYSQSYTGLQNIDADDFGYKLSMEKAHLVFE